MAYQPLGYVMRNSSLKMDSYGFIDSIAGVRTCFLRCRSFSPLSQHYGDSLKISLYCRLEGSRLMKGDQTVETVEITVFSNHLMLLYEQLSQRVQVL